MKRLFLYASTAALLMFALALSAQAVAPSPDALERHGNDRYFQDRIQRHAEFVERGGCSPAIHPINAKFKERAAAAASIPPDTARVLVLLLDFSDHPYNGATHGQGYASTPEDFDSLLFSIQGKDSIFNPSGSMTEYYLENSYGNFYIMGEVSDWIRMPQTYSYYVLDSADAGVTRSREFARDAIETADPTIDFSRYDYNNDGYMDGLILIHAGGGGEQGYFGIWSHMFSLEADTTLDGITIRDYVIGAEEFSGELSPIGVITHEFGHYFGLYDFYDLYEGDIGHEGSSGIGKWSLMASGNYNAAATLPAHLDPWSKAFLGFVTFDEVLFSGNVYQAEIPAVEYNPVIYKLANSSTSNYWLVENRQKVSFDAALPGHGLMIYHVDESVRDIYGRPTNSRTDRYFISAEQADGLDQLGETVNNSGDYGDNWPGATDNRNFNTFSSPNTLDYSNIVTKIGVWEISDSDSLMFADLDIEYSRPWIELDAANGVTVTTIRNDSLDSSIDPSDTVYLSFMVKNLMRVTSYGATATLSFSNPDITMLDDNAILASGLFGAGPYSNGMGDPIAFIMPDSIQPRIDSFFVTIEADSTASDPTPFTATFGFQLQLGQPSILIVDDDRGGSNEEEYVAVMERLLLPVDVWTVTSQGKPTAADLKKYSTVLWVNGWNSGTPLTEPDMNAMMSFLDGGGSLFLSTDTMGVALMSALKPSLMSNYFHAQYAGANLKWFMLTGSSGDPIWGGLRSLVVNSLWQTSSLLMAVSGGMEVLHLGDTNDVRGTCGVAHVGSYKSLLMTFPPESINNSQAGYDPIDSLMARVIEFFGLGFRTDVTDDIRRQLLPKAFSLKQNYPNPFNPSTLISFTINGQSSRTGAVKTNLSIFNLLGQQVRVLVDDVRSPGSYSVEWDGRTDGGGKVASGIYFYRLSYGEQSETKKMVLLK